MHALAKCKLYDEVTFVALAKCVERDAAQFNPQVALSVILVDYTHLVTSQDATLTLAALVQHQS